MKKLLLLFSIFPVFFVNAQLAITSYDTSLYPLDNEISFYCYYLENGKVWQKTPAKDEFKLTEVDDTGKSFPVTSFKITPTDKKNVQANFVFLIDNSLSMYFYLPEKEIAASDFENEILAKIPAESDRKFLLKYYKKEKEKYVLGETSHAIRMKIGEVINAHSSYKVKTKMDFVKEAVALFIHSVPDGMDNKLLISFNRNSTEHSGFIRDTSRILEEAQKITRPEDDLGWTELYEALDAGTARVASKGGRRFIILLSDGYQKTDSEEDKTPYLTRAMNRVVKDNITIFPIGFGDTLDSSLLKDLATLSGGSYISSHDRASLMNAYKKIADILNSEVKISYRAGMFKRSSRHIVVQYKGHTTKKAILITPFFGKPLVPFTPLVFLLLLIGAILFIMIVLIMRREVAKDAFINVTTGKKVLLSGDTMLLRDTNSGTHIIKKDGTYMVSGTHTFINNKKVADTRRLAPGDVITTDEGTRILFTGKE